MNRKRILLALKALLSPVATFCVRHGLKVQDAESVFKIALLEAARRELESQSLDVNASRLSATTGIPRKFVPKFLSDRALEESQGDVITRIVGQWQSDTRFQDNRGKPRALNITGAESEFNGLVLTVSADLNSYTVLNELIRLGHVERKGAKLKLRTRLHLVKKLPEAMALVAQDTEALQRAAEENVSLHEPKHLHLTTRYDNIPASAIGTIEKWLLAEGSALHRRARALLSALDRDVSPGAEVETERRHRVHLGAFSFTERYPEPKNPPERKK